MPLISAISSQKINIKIKKITIETKIRFAKFIPLIEVKINIAAVVKVAPLRPVIPSFSSISMIIKPIKDP